MSALVGKKSKLLTTEDLGPVWLLEDQTVISAIVGTCPKCGWYLETIPIDWITAALIHTLGRMRCIRCGYIPDLDIYDKTIAMKTENSEVFMIPMIIERKDNEKRKGDNDL